MDDSRRSSSSFKPSTAVKLTSSDFQGGKRGAVEMGSEEIKENDQPLPRGAGLGAGNLKKEHKNLASTPKLAASKKKVLAEKNDAAPSECSGTYSEGNPEIKKPGQIHGRPGAAPWVTSFPSGPHIHRSEEETVVSSETQPYDPLTNYLSPRPEFLRYNPNRRKEVYLRRERELKGSVGSSGFNLRGSFEVESSSSEGTPSESPALPSVRREGLDVKSLQYKETHGNMEEEEDDDSVEEEEQEQEEERPSCCNLVSKGLFLLGVLFFSTCYISYVLPSSAVPSHQNFRFSNGNLFKVPDSCQEVGENVEILNLDTFVGTYMNVCIQGHFNELANWRNGINGYRLDSPLRSGDFGDGKLQEEGHARAMWAGNVNSSTSLVVVEGTDDESEESRDKSEMTDAQGSGMLIDHFPVMEEGEIQESASHSEETQHDSEMVRAEDSYKIGGEKEESINIVEALNLEHVNDFTGAVAYEQHAEDVIMGTEVEEADDMTEQLRKPEQSTEKELKGVPDHDEEDTSTLWSSGQGMNLENKWDISSPPLLFPGTVEDPDASRVYRIKMFTIILMVFTVAASTIIGVLHFWKASKASDEDSSASLLGSGLEAEEKNSSELAKMEKTGDKCFNFPVNADTYRDGFNHSQAVKSVETGSKGFNFLVSTDKYKEVYENLPPAVKLVEERFADTLVNIDKSKERYERKPPEVKLLGEFSVVEQGISETKNPSLRKKSIRIEEQHSLPEDMSMRKSQPFAEEANKCSSELLTPESSRTPVQEKLVRKQKKSGHRQEAAKVASTPVRRSSRIRNQVISPGA